MNIIFNHSIAHKVNNIYSAIYYGDADVDVGEPFSITCIISISDPIEWLKDGTPINIQSNLRHVKDYVFIESDSDIEGIYYIHHKHNIYFKIINFIDIRSCNSCSRIMLD